MTRAPEEIGRYYASALDKNQQHKLIEALEIEGIDDEIAFIRAWLSTHTKDQQLNAITGAVNAIVRAVQARYRLTPHDADEIIDRAAKAIEAVARGVIAEAKEEVIDDV
jgi:hypothetical protein